MTQSTKIPDKKLEAIKKKREQQREEQLESPNTNAVLFVEEVVKDTICDWIVYHNGPVKRKRIIITDMDFGWRSIGAAAQYFVSPFERYVFYIRYDRGEKMFLTSVIDPYTTKSGFLTKDWDGRTHLEFDNKGRSYEVTREEAKIIDTYKKLKHPHPKDKFYYCEKCKTKFAANSLDIWIDEGLKCPVCGQTVKA